ncbi:MAG: metallophosphoesterase family protein [Candidatus Dormibacteraceae bacterium]
MFEELEERLHSVLERVRGRTPDTPPTSTPGRVVREVMDARYLRDSLRGLKALAGEAVQPPAQAFDEADQELAEAIAGVNAGTPFMPHTPATSILQSLLTTCIESRATELLQDAGEGGRRLAHAVLADAEVYRHYGPCDPRWILTGVAEGLSKFERRPPFPDQPAAPVRLARDARVVVVGDWGTGLPGAVQVARQIRARLAEATGRERHVVHLGDVYYCGWREEYQSRFLAHWPVDPDDGEVLSWALTGNHDMFSGGHGYFGFLLHDPRFRGHWRGDPAEHPPSSHFSIENDHWQVLGLDSSYIDHDLAGSQEQWLGEKLRAGRKTMLLSHHQPFSAYVADVPQVMTEKVQRALPTGASVDAWLWGHEHRCTIYGDWPKPYLRFGSCLGNGGVPLLLPDPPLQPLPEAPGYASPTWAYDGAEEAAGNRWLRFGFAILDFDGPHLTIRYVDEHNTETKTTTLA